MLSMAVGREQLGLSLAIQSLIGCKPWRDRQVIVTTLEPAGWGTKPVPAQTTCSVKVLAEKSVSISSQIPEMAKENLTHVLNKQIIISGNITNKELIDKAITDKALYKWIRKQIGGLPGLHPTDFNIKIGDN